ncbi:MAG: S-layer homology domain-containing protein [Clostridia bacterium]|nr:S-layer homology domain-containing protein [Clostridia bacterium]
MSNKRTLSAIVVILVLFGVLITNVSAEYAIVSGKCSDWAKEELDQANDLWVIPDSLLDVDLTQPITRLEFAAISVKAYEQLSGMTAWPASNPFTDTDDPEVLKALNVGITTGVSADKFDPNALLTREQIATMLTRVLKKSLFPNWTIKTDSDFALSYTKPLPFDDDDQISNWAKDSVYFMVANGVINGMGNNKFVPKISLNEEGVNGNATLEEAIIIAARMVDKFANDEIIADILKELDHSEDSNNVGSELDGVDTEFEDDETEENDENEALFDTEFD